MGFLLINQTSMIIFGLSEPMKYLSARRLEFFNEWLILNSGYFAFLFTAYLDDGATRYKVGTFLVAFVALNVSVNLTIMNLSCCKKSNRAARKKYKKYKVKKLLELKQQNLDKKDNQLKPTVTENVVKENQLIFADPPKQIPSPKQDIWAGI